MNLTDRREMESQDAAKSAAPGLDMDWGIASEVRRAGDQRGACGRSRTALAKLRFLGVVGAKLRAKVLPGRGAPKFHVAVAGTEWLAAEHAATRAAVDEIPAAREHRNLPEKCAVAVSIVASESLMRD
jgi:hypothetical protein